VGRNQKSPNRTAHHIMGYVSQWGGMDVGSGEPHYLSTILKFDSSITLITRDVPHHTFAIINRHAISGCKEWSGIDSTVENLKSSDRKHVKCPVGTAVITSCGGEQLRAEYDNIVHTVPPFYNYPPTATSGMKQLLGIDAESVDPESWSYELLRSCHCHSF
ncbi:hypothetical protein HJC23_006158, partial [Cyclotella cryptica]